MVVLKQSDWLTRVLALHCTAPCGCGVFKTMFRGGLFVAIQVDENFPENEPVSTNIILLNDVMEICTRPQSSPTALPFLIFV